MRGILLTAFLLALVPLAFASPYVGVLIWSWLSFMSPHRETYSFLGDAPIVFWVATGTLVLWILSRSPRPVIHERTAIIMIAFVVWTGISTAMAIDVGFSYPYFEQNLKTFALAFVVLAMLNSKARVQAMIWIIAISLGYYAVKGFGFTLQTAGRFTVLGPSGTAIGDNNNLGAALVFSLPLLNYLRLSSRRLAANAVLTFVMLATVVAVIGTYSRGGLVGLVIVGGLMWLSSRHKPLLTAGLVAVLVALPVLVAPQWYERMSTITAYTEDESFEGRLQAWDASTRIAMFRPLTGGGFNATQQDQIYANYNRGESLPGGRAAHSIYFQVLGDHGFVGLALYVLMLVIAFLNLSDVIRLARDREDLHWLGDLARMSRVSLLGMLSAGALLSMAYYDVLIVLIAITASMRLLAQSADRAAEERTQAPWIRTSEPT